MQFVLTAYDSTDADAPERRKQHRPVHLAKMKELKASGNYVQGGAILDDQGKYDRLRIIYDFPDRAAFDAYLRTDPYVTGKVWKDIDVRLFRVAGVA